MAKHLHTAQSEWSELCESVCLLCTHARVLVHTRPSLLFLFFLGSFFLCTVSSPKLQKDSFLSHINASALLFFRDHRKFTSVHKSKTCSNTEVSQQGRKSLFNVIWVSWPYKEAIASLSPTCVISTNCSQKDHQQGYWQCQACTPLASLSRSLIIHALIQLFSLIPPMK